MRNRQEASPLQEKTPKDILIVRLLPIRVGHPILLHLNCVQIQNSAYNTGHLSANQPPQPALTFCRSLVQSSAAHSPFQLHSFLSLFSSF